VDGTVLERPGHGQKGSMHAPLSGAELEAKFESLVSGLVAPGLAGIITSIATLTAADLGAALRPTR
jgi:hypothetical protein